MLNFAKTRQVRQELLMDNESGILGNNPCSLEHESNEDFMNFQLLVRVLYH